VDNQERLEIRKSSRHSKITGDFGEALVLYLLSKHGFECARIDHTGIDLIARNPSSPAVMGISVKSRSRSAGAEAQNITIRKDDITKAQAACEAFHCEPYFAFVIDADSTIRVFLTSLAHFEELFPISRTTTGWQMTSKHLERYAADPHVQRFELAVTAGRWW
jgi:Holliday junction resolvase-like predicted endonuclease